MNIKLPASFGPAFSRRLLGMATGLFAVLCPSLGGAGEIDFNRDVRPILAENCFSCHGLDEKARKAELRLDVAASAYAMADGLAAIVPKNPEKSEAFRRINSNDPNEMMPPKKKPRLSDVQKRTLKQWIEEGAVYKGHWAFEAPKKPTVPKVPVEWQAPHDNVIDAFVRSRLVKENLKPNPEADRATLIRRVTLDLLGVPPSAEEVLAFERDPDPQAYEKLVERLLKSPHLGERLALDWLDAARYADTNGYSIDGGRQMWLWRDWVIQAFNDNKPYDRFLLEQLAGDLLPNRTEADLIATGFQRNNMVTHEGGTIPAENLANYNADRVKTLGEAVLGLTLGCSQCHNHKYDPITQKDYYRMIAYFNTLADKGLDGDGGVNPGPRIRAKTVLRTDEVEQLRKQIAELKEKLATPMPRVLREWEEAELAKFKRRGEGFTLHRAKVLKVSTPNRGAGFEVEDGQRVRLAASSFAAYDISLALPKLDRPITGLRATFLPNKKGDWGYGFWKNDKGAKRAKDAKGTFIVTAIASTADTIPADQINLYKLLGIRGATASSWDSRFPPAGALGTRSDTGWSPAPNSEGPVHLSVTFSEPIDSAKTPFLTTQLYFGFGQNMAPELIEFEVFTGEDDGTDLPTDIVAILNAPGGKRSEEQLRELWQYCARHAPALQRERTNLANLEDRLDVLTGEFPVMVMNVAEKPRPTFVLYRGDYAQPREQVTTGTPEALPALSGAPANRLGLAKWITMPNHPLTARVAVNRYWQLLFGAGIVATAADFGTQGSGPSHPDLLDWLAVDFVEHGWDVRNLLRLIVTSATYRQSSVATSEMHARDPGNRLLARGPRFRLSAELIRDSALKVSGLWVPRIGGPSVNPYSPGNLWREVSHYGSTPATAQTFIQDHGEKLYRRSLYTYLKRSAPPPNMAAFDAPNREVCVVARPSTTTPLQALVLLNDTQFVEASRAFAERMLARSESDENRVRWAFREALSRAPTDKEMSVLLRALQRERQRYQADPAAARSYLAIGESPRQASLDAAEHAAWAQVGALILNLSEFVTRS
jgi:hypothetical protein